MKSKQSLSQEEKRRLKLHEVTTQPVEKLVCKYAIPTIVTMLITALYNFADTYFVSGMSDAATAAVGIVYPMVSLTNAGGYFWGQGSANFISRKIGQGDTEEAKQMAQFGFSSALFSSTILAVLGLIFIKPLCLLLGSPNEILHDSMIYCALILPGFPFIMSGIALNCQFRYQGNAISSMTGMASGAILNIILDPLFIYGFGWGLVGAGIATTLSQIISFVILFRQSRQRGNIPIRLIPHSYPMRYLKSLVPGGLPSLCRNGLQSMAVAVVNIATKPYGVSAVAAMSVMQKIVGVGIAVATGFCQGAQPVWGMNYGARRYDRVLRAYWFTLAGGMLINILVAIGGRVFCTQLVGLFQSTKDSNVMEYGVPALQRESLTFALTAFLIITNMLAQTIGRAGSATFLAVARCGLFLIPIVLVFSRLWGMEGILWSQPVADCCSFLSTFFVLFPMWKDLKQKKETEAQSGNHL